ncbi:MAG: ATP-binding protein [Oligoflexales bacterium]
MIANRIPFTLKLSLGHGIWMACLFTFLGLSVYKVVSHVLLNSVDIALLSTAESIRDSHHSHRQAHISPGELLSMILEADHFDAVDDFMGARTVRPFAQLIHVSGKVRSRSINHQVSLPVSRLAVTRAELGDATLETFGSDGDSIRQITIPVFQRGYFTGDLIQVGTSLREAYRALRILAAGLSTILPCLLFLSILVGYRLTAQALRPVRDIARAAASLGIDDMSIRLPVPKARDELQNLTNTFNAMLDRLEESVTKLQRFAGAASHELRTPLAVLRGEAEFALRRERSNDDYRKSLSNIVNESQQMTMIVEDLLLFARAQSRALHMSWASLGLGQFIASLRQMVDPVFEQLDVELEVLYPDNVNIEASPRYLSLAMKNILQNAAQHSPAHSKVRLSISRQGPWLEMTIQDHGHGIPPEAVPHVFEAFYRVDTARTRTSGGSGVGLSLTKALIQLHSGTVEVSSELGKGTRFEIRIPQDHLLEKPEINEALPQSHSASVSNRASAARRSRPKSEKLEPS